MHCGRKIPGKNIVVDRTWEVHLDSDLWEALQKAAALRGKTFSWVTRYCIFRLAQRQRLYLHPPMQRRICDIKKRQESTHYIHRHVICLYGEDEALLRTAAFHLRLSVSMFIRLCLDWFLPKLTNIVSNKDLYENGIKIMANLQCKRQTRAFVLLSEVWVWQQFSLRAPPV